MTPDKNEKGEYATWDKGRFIGFFAVVKIDDRKVLLIRKTLIEGIKAAAKNDGILLRLNSGFRTFAEQLDLRKQYAPADKKNDEEFLLRAKSDKFTPPCAPPGWSNHQDGDAFDFMVRDDVKTPEDESLAYKWLVKNAIKFGLIRTVRSERWHWEYRPGKDMFSSIPKTDPSWDKLV